MLPQAQRLIGEIRSRVAAGELVDKAAGILFASREGGRWWVCLARSVSSAPPGRLGTATGRVRHGEKPLDAAFRVAREKWFGDGHVPDVEERLEGILPPGFDWEAAARHVQSCPDGLELHTFLVSLTNRFSTARLAFHGEFLPDSAGWFSTDNLPASVLESASESIKNFNLLAVTG